MRKSVVDTIRTELECHPLQALQTYEDAIAGDKAAAADLEAIFEPMMGLARFGKAIDENSLVEKAPALFASPRHVERQLLVSACADQLVLLGQRGEKERLARIGNAFEALVVEGTQPQQLCGRIAIALGDKSEAEVRPLLEPVGKKLVEALQVVLRAGAATTRDSAVEGLGALLKFYPPAEAEAMFKQPVKPDAVADKAQQNINRIYFERLDRRRLMAFAVARDPAKRRELGDTLREVVAKKIDAIRVKESDPEQRNARLLDALYSRADLLRTLPAVVRQAHEDERQELFLEAIEFLKDAATFTGITEDDDAVMVAFAQFQESVFRTIDVMIKRGATHDDFDVVLAQALDATPRTLVGRASVCNAQVRATVALLRTASRLISNDKKGSETKRALEAIFAALIQPSPWPNLGITEGCYKILPFLASNHEHDGLSLPALEKLFARIKSPPPFGDLAETHHQLVASACFRQLILRLMSRTDEHSAGDAASVRIQRDVSRLLAEPAAARVLEAFQNTRTWASVMQKPSPAWTAGLVIAGTAFENDLLDFSGVLYTPFEERPSVERLLLTRILAAQLRATSLDSRKIARYALLRDFYANSPANRAADRERIEKVRRLVASLPPRAAQAADPDLQEFLEHCGRRAADALRANVEDLPGHVLAMVSDNPSSRIADAIAREIDLSMRHWKQRKHVDLAKLLYQVVLRGPNESIFGHLLPRVDDDDRPVVSLFYRHVKSVRADANLTPEQLLAHVNELAHDIADDTPSETLRRLKSILTRYSSLFANDTAIWDALTAGEEGGGLAQLFAEFDEIVRRTHVAEPTTKRELLSKAYAAATAQLQKHVDHYRELAAGEFESRSEALADARDAAGDIGRLLVTHSGLQPPERVMLIALMQRLQDFFRRTVRWYCDEPRRRKKARKEARDPEMFFILFASRKMAPLAQIFEAAESLSRHDLEATLQEQINADRTALALARISAASGPAPAEFPEQRERFEKLFVEWMESELDVDMLQRHLEERWAWPFAMTYGVMTSFLGISTLILIPCVVAIAVHLAGLHEVEGVGFFFLEAFVLLAAFVSFIPRLRAGARMLWRRLRRKTTESAHGKGPPYYFQALVPRLARLIVVPLALTVEFDHSYTFPLHASTLALVLLIALSFFATRFFIDREIVEASESPDATPERVRLGKVVALALSHAFLIGVLLATIFGSHAQGVPEPEHHPHNWLDRMPDKKTTGHQYPYFAAVLARDVRFDMTWPRFMADELHFTYYPTIILAWTALGLFIGVFLEGFVKGERLRGEERSEEGDADA